MPRSVPLLATRSTIRRVGTQGSGEAEKRRGRCEEWRSGGKEPFIGRRPQRDVLLDPPGGADLPWISLRDPISADLTAEVAAGETAKLGARPSCFHSSYSPKRETTFATFPLRP
jgi:hypothetical protein